MGFVIHFAAHIFQKQTQTQKETSSAIYFKISPMFPSVYDVVINELIMA